MNTQIQYQASLIAEKYSNISNFFIEALDICSGKNFVDILNNLIPNVGKIVGEVADSTGEAFGIVKFALSIIQKVGSIKETKDIGYLLCNLAYQKALKKTVEESYDKFNFTLEKEDVQKLQNTLRLMKKYDFDLKSFDFDSVLSHSFIIHADAVTSTFLLDIGVNQYETRRIINDTHSNYFSCFRELLASHRNKAQFSDFIESIKNKKDEEKARILLKEHADYQKWLFEEKPLFEEKEFSLNDIYVQMKCNNINPSSSIEWDADLGHKVFSYIENDEFNQPIIIEGTAGSGKSSFTLWLCAELIERGYRPIRIPFKLIEFDPNKKFFDDEDIYKILAKTINFKDAERYGKDWPQVNVDLFCGGKIFNERIPNKKINISPYVIILDGWDELTLSAQKSFTEFLNGLYKTFINHNNNIIRLILTGRPSNLINTNCKILANKPPILDIKQLNANLLKELFEKLNIFNKLDSEIINKIINDYEYNRNQTYEILGLPLLVFIVHELLSDPNNQMDYKKLFSNKAILYKQLADLTCENAGKRKQIKKEELDAHIYGESLRNLLQKTAKIISLKGSELVSYDDLSILLKDDELDIAEEDISKIIISYYFKGGHHNAGCEFVHKSFREYFCAEALMNCFDEYYREIQDLGNATSKKVYLKNNIAADFKEDTPIFKLSRSLSEIICLRAVTNEVFEFFVGLLDIELSKKNIESKHFGPIIRDGLIQIWEWWLKEIPVKYDIDVNDELKNPLLLNIIEPYLSLNVSKLALTITNLDSFLGSGILKFCVLIHKVLLQKAGINSLEKEELKFIENSEKRNFQTSVTLNNQRAYAFMPIGLEERSANHSALIQKNFINRILNTKSIANLELLCCDLRGVDLSYLTLDNINLTGSTFKNAVLKGVNFINLIAKNTNFNNADMFMANLESSDFDGATLKKVNLVNANLNETILTNTNLDEALLTGVYAENVDFSSASIQDIDFERANLKNANLNNTNISNSNLKYANLNGARLSDATLIKADLTRSDLSNSNTHQAILKNANFNMAKLVNANFLDANMTNCCFVGADLSGADLRRTNLNFNNIKNSDFKNAKTTGTKFSKVNFSEVKNITLAQRNQAIIRNVN